MFERGAGCLDINPYPPFLSKTRMRITLMMMTMLTCILPAVQDSARALFRFMSKQAGSSPAGCYCYLELFLLLIQFSTNWGCVPSPPSFTMEENLTSEKEKKKEVH